MIKRVYMATATYCSVAFQKSCIRVVSYKETSPDSLKNFTGTEYFKKQKYF